MAKCVKLKRTKTEVCIGNMRYRIDIFIRTLTSPLNPTGPIVDYTETFTLVDNVWAMIETPKGKVIFDSVGVEKRITDVFYIRFLPSITSQNWVEFNGNRYDIERVRNLEENSLFLQLDCIIRGAIDKEASEA